MKNFLKFFFTKITKYPLGSLDGIKDSRTIATVAVQAPVILPDDYTANTSPVDMQSTTDCVAEAIKGIKEDYLLDGNNFIALEPLDLYNQCKAIDGSPDQAGTYPLVGAKLAVSSGIASKNVYASGDILAIEADRAKYKLGGFMAVGTTYDEVCQAIFQNKRITAAFAVDTDWFSGIIGKVLQTIGKHYVKLHGFYRPQQMIRGQNSWGITWIGKVAGWIDPSLAPGHFDVHWPDVLDTVTDIYAFTDSIPAPILAHVQTLNYHFNRTMKYGDQNYDVMQLQKRLAQEGMWPKGQSFTGYYGTVTAQYIFAYQMAHKVITDGSESEDGDICGPKTIRMLNGQVGLDEVNAQIEVESEGNDYSVGDLNIPNHAYGCLQIRQGVCDAVNAKCGTTYKAQDMLGSRANSLDVRTKYFTEVYPEFDTWQKRAMAWNGGPGYMEMYQKNGYNKYTAQLDTYVARMASYMA